MLSSMTRLLGGEARWCFSMAGPPCTLQHLASLTSLGQLLGIEAVLPAAQLRTCHRSQPAAWQQQQQQRGFSAAALLSARAGGEAGEVGLASGGGGQTGSSSSKEVLYKGRGMRLFRILVRMKIFQLTGVAALAIPITTFLSQGEVSAMQAVIASALLLGSGVASTALWYYSRRYVGELALLRDTAGRPTAARFSVLDFWGNREDNDVQLLAIVPPFQGVLPQVRTVMLDEMLIPLDVEGDRQYFLSLRHGHILDKRQLLALLEGRLLQQQQQGAEGSTGSTADGETS